MNNTTHTESMGGQTGLFIVIEGADGTGKSTQYQLVKKGYLNKVLKY